MIGYYWALNSDALAYARGAAFQSTSLAQKLGALKSVELAFPSNFSIRQDPGGSDRITLTVAVKGAKGAERVRITMVGKDDSWRLVSSSPSIGNPDELVTDPRTRELPPKNERGTGPDVFQSLAFVLFLVGSALLIAYAQLSKSARRKLVTSDSKAPSNGATFGGGRSHLKLVVAVGTTGAILAVLGAVILVFDALT